MLWSAGLCCAKWHAAECSTKTKKSIDGFPTLQTNRTTRGWLLILLTYSRFAQLQLKETEFINMGLCLSKGKTVREDEAPPNQKRRLTTISEESEDERGPDSKRIKLTEVQSDMELSADDRPISATPKAENDNFGEPFVASTSLEEGEGFTKSQQQDSGHHEPRGIDFSNAGLQQLRRDSEEQDSRPISPFTQPSVANAH